MPEYDMNSQLYVCLATSSFAVTKEMQSKALAWNGVPDCGLSVTRSTQLLLHQANKTA